VGQCGSIQSFAPGGVNFLPSVKSQAQDLKDQFQSKLSSINPAARGAQTALKKAEKASVSALASLAALPGLPTSQRAAISGLEKTISNASLPSWIAYLAGLNPAGLPSPSELKGIAAGVKFAHEYPDFPMPGVFAAGLFALGAIGAGGDGDADVFLGCGESFTANTRVLLAPGTAVRISQIAAGDKVLATNTKTGKTQAEPVTAVLVHHDTDLYDLTIRTARGTAVIHTTRNHLFWDPSGHRWVKAAALKVYPPNQTAPVYLPNTSTACSKPVQTMNIGPVQAGSGGST